MKRSFFFRLLPHDDKAAALAEAVAAVSQGHTLNPVVHTVDPNSFRQVPGSPFAYWIGEHVRWLFAELDSLESSKVHAGKGPDTGDDFRFLRAWWEIVPGEIGKGKRWIDHAKGGEFSRFYSDVHLLIDWSMGGEVIRRHGNMRNPNFFFRPGITWPRRTTSSFGPRLLPAGCILGDKGPAAFVDDDNPDRIMALLAVMNSLVFHELIKLQLGAASAAARSYEVGIVQQVPVPKLFEDETQLIKLACSATNLKCSLDTANETSHIFHLPAVLQVGAGFMPARSEAGRSQGSPLQERITSWQARVAEAERQLAGYQRKIDDIAFRLYGIEGEDRRAIEEVISDKWVVTSEEDSEDNGAEEDQEDSSLVPRPSSLVPDLLSYAVGCVFGRWDVRFVTGERPAPELSDPFAPLPVCSPGMLTDDNGLPLREAPSDYPLQIDWDSILVDDPDHLDDIVRRVRDVLEVLWGDRAEAIEREACETLGVRDLRDYFRKPGNGGFWMDHVKRYSKSRRKAPIYWLLQSSRKNYALWLYYHRLDKDVLFKALVNYVEPKLRLEESRLEQVRAQRFSARTSGREAKQLERQLDRQETLLSELRDFHDKLRRTADLHLEPDLNDGVVLNIAPLWELVPWSEAKKYWEELLAGKYEWSSISQQLRQKGLVGRG